VLYDKFPTYSFFAMIPPLCDFKIALTVFAAQRVYVFSAVMPLPQKEGRDSRG